MLPVRIRSTGLWDTLTEAGKAVNLQDMGKQPGQCPVHKTAVFFAAGIRPDQKGGKRHVRIGEMQDASFREGLQ